MRAAWAEEAWAAAEAGDLLTAQRSRIPVVPLSASRPGGLTLRDAYRVQAAVVAARQASGARPIGHKVGVTSKAMQHQMGVDEPDSGVLFDDMVVPAGGVVAAADLLSPRVEAEIAFRLGRDLTGPYLDAPQVRRAVSEVLLALEVIDTRYGNWDISVADSIADNASCARVVAGIGVPFDPDWDLGSERLIVAVNGRPAATGKGRAVLGDPLNPLIWLAQRLHLLGSALRAGDLVLAGAVHASLPLQPGTEVTVTSPRLPAVGVRVT